VNETWAGCAKREVKEETDLEITNTQFAYVTNDPAIDGGALCRTAYSLFDSCHLRILTDETKHYVTIFVRGTAVEGAEAKLMEPHKCEGKSALKHNTIGTDIHYSRLHCKQVGAGFYGQT
jgi:ADP-ribose pyrophosphatase YjhB (NUDIX family)